MLGITYRSPRLALVNVDVDVQHTETRTKNGFMSEKTKGKYIVSSGAVRKLVKLVLEFS